MDTLEQRVYELEQLVQGLLQARECMDVEIVSLTGRVASLEDANNSDTSSEYFENRIEQLDDRLTRKIGNVERDLENKIDYARSDLENKINSVERGSRRW